MLFGYTVLDFLIVIVTIIVSLTIHEAMHAYVGLRLGDTTAAEEGRVSFNPLQHIDPVMTVALPIITLIVFHAPILAAKPVPFDPRRVRYDEFGAALIAVAGPLSNLALAIIGALLIHIVGSPLLVDALYIFISINITLFIFNLIPIPPLDGSRVLYAFAPEPLQQLMAQLEQVGLFIVFLVAMTGGFAGILGNIHDFVLRLLV